MSIRAITASLIFSAATVLTGCATSGAPTEHSIVNHGVIEQINPAQIHSPHHLGVGAIVGGVAGLGVGSLIGRGTGRDVAKVLGVIGGTIAGSEIQRSYDQPYPGQQIIVRTDSGVLIAVTQPTNPSLRAGQRVHVEGSGEAARVVSL